MEINKDWPVHYRYETYTGSKGITLYCKKYLVVKETAKCYYVVSENSRPYYLPNETVMRAAKRILKESRKRYCYPTRAEALVNFKARKKTQLAILDYQAKVANACIDTLKGLGEIDGEPPNEIFCGYGSLDSSYFMEY